MILGYEQKYKEALERARKIENGEPLDVPDGTSIPVAIFPELGESNDEKIRKALIEHFSWNTKQILNEFSNKETLAWIEKQEEQNHTWSEDDELLLKDVLAFIETGWSCKGKSHLVHWLKSIKNKTTWNPSEKQGNNADKVKQQQAIEIPFGAKDSELQEATYHIPDGYHAEINGNEVVIKKGEQKPIEYKDEALSKLLNKVICYFINNPDIPYSERDEVSVKLIPYVKMLEKQDDKADKVEPKFKVGDWVVWQDKCYKVNYNGCGYELVDKNGLSTSLEYGTIDENAHLWTIEDAKEGDVLCTYECDEPKIVFILKGTLKKHRALSYYCYYNIKHPYFKTDSETGCLAPNEEDVKPATKEQRDILFQKMKEKGYEWDADKKELIKL